MLFGLGGHMLLGLLLPRVGGLPVAHSLGITLGGMLHLVTTRRSNVPRAAMGLTSYVIGAEVLWRMTGGAFFWEFGKYATAAFLVIALVRSVRWSPPAAGAGYFFMLLPAVPLTFLALDFELARQRVSFNMSGPLVIFLATWFFYRRRLGIDDFLRMALATLGPLVAVVTIALGGIVTRTIEFGTQSNVAASGGFGPNQVSAMMGLGAVLATYVFLLERRRGGRLVPAVMLGLAGAFLVQGLLTFSRGGPISAVLAVGLGLLFMLRDPRLRQRAIMFGALAAVAVSILIVPQVDSFTDGALARRYAREDVSNRDVLVRRDIGIFLDNLALGVGPGAGNSERDGSAAHTEFTRMLAEHGLPGALALVWLIMLAVGNTRRARPGLAQALATSLSAWTFFFMASNATRLAAPCFVLGLASAALLAEGQPARAAPGSAAPTTEPLRPLRPRGASIAGGHRSRRSLGQASTERSS